MSTLVKLESPRAVLLWAPWLRLAGTGGSRAALVVLFDVPVSSLVPPETLGFLGDIALCRQRKDLDFGKSKVKNSHVGRSTAHFYNKLHIVSTMYSSLFYFFKSNSQNTE
jgi:hypothetical protein